MREWKNDEWKREKSISKVSCKFLSDYFIFVLEGIFITFLLGKNFCVNAYKKFPKSNNQKVAFGIRVK
jgi:hypothetical protein